MPDPLTSPDPQRSDALLLLGIDTCGPIGSVALGRLTACGVEILGQIELEGRSYSATLIAVAGDLLSQAGAHVADLGCIVAVNGPGSFTGVRVGLSAIKGLAEPTGISVVAVSRLEVLAWKAGVASSALDAHRSEVFLRLSMPGKTPQERLAGAADLAALAAPPHRVAVGDDSAAVLIRSGWPAAEVIRVPAPSAADALLHGAPRIAAGKFVDLALLDGHYLRRSDAEIFGEPAAARRA
jgi:tRNA threonylcarbamoyladenosine biosynthesis protein TsaB